MSTKRAGARARARTLAAVLRRDGYVCRWCGGLATTQDHLIPLKMGGPDTLENLAAACGPCNYSRGARLGPPPRLARLTPPAVHDVVDVSTSTGPRFFPAAGRAPLPTMLYSPPAGPDSSGPGPIIDRSGTLVSAFCRKAPP